MYKRDQRVNESKESRLGEAVRSAPVYQPTDHRHFLNGPTLRRGGDEVAGGREEEVMDLREQLQPSQEQLEKVNKKLEAFLAKLDCVETM